MKTKIKIYKTVGIVTLIIFILGISFLLAVSLFVNISHASKFFPKTYIAGVDLGGKTKDEAQDILTSKIQNWSEQTLKIKTDEKTWQIPNKDLGADFDIKKTIDDTFLSQRSGGFKEQFLAGLESVFFGFEEPMAVKKDESEKATQKVISEANVEASNSDLKIEDGKVIETQEKLGRQVNETSLKYLIKDYFTNLSSQDISLPQEVVYPNSNLKEIEEVKKDAEEILKARVAIKAKEKVSEISGQEIQNWLSITNEEPINGKKQAKSYELKLYLDNLLENAGVIQFLNSGITVKLDKEKVSEYLKGIAQEVSVAPQNASLGVQNEKVVVLTSSKDGDELDINSSVERILNALKKKETEVLLPFKTVKAQVREDNILDLGIIELISRGESDFTGSSSSRKQNITVGSSKFNNILIAPDEEFSFNKNLGEVNAANGYAPELVIKPGKTTKEYGGGICQVSTTTFRAALLAGLPITERKAHSYAVKYYLWPWGESGVDATVYGPHPDLRFKNDTGKYILIQTYIKGNRLTFDFYGTKGSRRAEIVKPVVIQRNPDGSFKTVFYRNIYKGDQLVKKDTFYSSYRPASEFPAAGN